MDEEKIIWKGRPTYKPRLAFLELVGGDDVIISIVIALLFILLILKAMSTPNIWISILCISVIIIAFLIPEVHKNYRRKRTVYELTKKDIKIKDTWYGKELTRIISLNDIDRIVYVSFKDDSGRIHLMVNKELNINTRNFWSGSYHSTIALEDVENISKVYPVFTRALREFRLNNK